MHTINQRIKIDCSKINDIIINAYLKVLIIIEAYFNCEIEKGKRKEESPVRSGLN